MEAPSWLEIGSLFDERFHFKSYWERLSNLPVNTPNTTIIPLDETQYGVSNYPTDEIKSWMDTHEYNRAFVRSGYKAAPIRIRDGSIIKSNTEKEIKQTVDDLLTQHIHSNIPTGGYVVVRELIDLRFCMQPHVMCHPELRYFIENGEVIYQTPSKLNLDEHICASQYDFLQQTLDVASFPTEMVEIVATEFSERPFSVDFVMDTSGTWYVSEIHLNGVYWNENNNEWMNMCGHGDIETLSPQFIHSAALSHVREHTQIK